MMEKEVEQERILKKIKKKISFKVPDRLGLVKLLIAALLSGCKSHLQCGA